MAQVILAGLGIWFAAALVVGVALGKMIAAADRAAGIQSSEPARDVHRAA